MELIKQVANLELSKRLKKLGIKQESFWYWKSRSYLGVFYNVLVEGIPELKDRAGFYSAFTVAELGEIIAEKGGTWKEGKVWRWNLTNERYANSRNRSADTEANARAKCLIYLIENNLLNLDKKQWEKKAEKK